MTVGSLATKPEEMDSHQQIPTPIRIRRALSRHALHAFQAIPLIHDERAIKTRKLRRVLLEQVERGTVRSDVVAVETDRVL